MKHAASEADRDRCRQHCRSHGQDLQPVRLHAASRRASRSASAPRMPAATPADEAVADLLQHEVHRSVRRQGSLVRFGEGERDEEERDADSVVQAALDVEPLPDPRRDPLVGDDRLAERRVGAGEHDREHERLDQADAGQHADPGERAEGDRQRQANPEQPGRHRELLTQGRERDPGGVGEEDERQRRLRQQLDGLAADAQIDQPEDRSRQQARGREEDRRCDERTLEPAGGPTNSSATARVARAPPVRARARREVGEHGRRRPHAPNRRSAARTTPTGAPSRRGAAPPA